MYTNSITYLDLEYDHYLSHSLNETLHWLTNQLVGLKTNCRIKKKISQCLIPYATIKFNSMDFTSALSNIAIDNNQTLFFLFSFPTLPRRPRLDLAAMSEKECWSYFRFAKGHLARLGMELQHCENRATEIRNIALCILLRRFAYPSQYMDLWQMFGWHPSEISLIFVTNGPPEYKPLYLRISIPFTGCKLTIWSNTLVLYRIKGQLVRWKCRGWHSVAVKRVHCLQFQSLMLPNGLIGHIFGPMEQTSWRFTVVGV